MEWLEQWGGEFGVTIGRLLQRMHAAVAHFVMWLIRPELGMLLREMDKSLTGLEKEKVGWSDVMVKGDGTLIKPIVTAGDRERSKEFEQK